MTADNASNNDTLIAELQKSLPEDTTVVRVSCLAHVIQLSLNDLLGHMKAIPVNDTVNSEWTEQRSQSSRANTKKRDITTAQSKVRCIYLTSTSLLYCLYLI